MAAVRPVMMLVREPARPAVVREHRLAPWFAVATVCLGAFMGQLDASVVTLVFPALQRQFGAGLAEVQWVSLAYLLTLVAALVPVGRWSDRLGRKLIYLYGFALFIAASAASGLAPSLTVLIVLRVVQAAGAAMLQANSVALVSTSVPEHARRAALGVQAGAQALGLAAGPVAGGLLVASAGWRWVFLINIPVGLVAVLAGVFLLPRTRQHAIRSGADPLGTALLVLSAASLLVAVSAWSGLGLPVSYVVIAATAAVVSGVALGWWERRASAPLIDLPMLAVNGIGRSLAGAMSAYMVLFGPLVLLPQTLTARGYGPLHAGLVLAALPAGFGLAAVASERVLPQGWSNRLRCGAGGLLAASAVAAMILPGLPTAATVACLMLAGAGLGIYIPANNAQVMTAVPARDAAMAGGMVNMARGLGTALGVAIVTLCLHAGAQAGRTSPVLPVAALAAVGVIAVWAGARPASPSRLAAVATVWGNGERGGTSD